MEKKSHRETSWPLIIIESPFAGDEERNTTFAKNICRWAITNKFNPFASHLYYTLFLDDVLASERALGINLGFEMSRQADGVWFCTLVEDPDVLLMGVSKGIEPKPYYSAGMQRALSYYIKRDSLTIREMFFGLNGQHYFEKRIWPKEDLE